MSDNSQYIFNDGRIKSRLIDKGKNKHGQDWYIAEWKYVNDYDDNGNPKYTGLLSEEDPMPRNIWFPWICGTADWLGLTEQDKKWATKR
jgi:hypothetical protein